MASDPSNEHGRYLTYAVVTESLHDGRWEPFFTESLHVRWKDACEARDRKDQELKDAAAHVAGLFGHRRVKTYSRARIYRATATVEIRKRG
jgi:hypothetical protein